MEGGKEGNESKGNREKINKKEEKEKKEEQNGELMTLPGKFLSGYSGQVADAIGWQGFFLYTSALGVPALLLAVILFRRGYRETPADPASGRP